MKKCLHLKKTKPHWRAKPPKVVTWRDKLEAKRKADDAKRAFTRHVGFDVGPIHTLGYGGAGISMALARVMAQVRSSPVVLVEPED